MVLVQFRQVVEGEATFNWDIAQHVPDERGTPGASEDADFATSQHASPSGKREVQVSFDLLSHLLDPVAQVQSLPKCRVRDIIQTAYPRLMNRP